MTSTRYERNKPFLKFLASTPTLNQRQAVIKTATEDQVVAVCEIILNVLAGNVAFTPQDIKKLAVYRKDLRRVGSKNRTSWKTRRAILAKVGKIVTFIIQKTLEQDETQ